MGFSSRRDGQSGVSRQNMLVLITVIIGCSASVSLLLFSPFLLGALLGDRDASTLMLVRTAFALLLVNVALFLRCLDFWRLRFRPDSRSVRLVARLLALACLVGAVILILPSLRSWSSATRWAVVVFVSVLPWRLPSQWVRPHNPQQSHDLGA